MSLSPGLESPNTLTIDLASNADLKEIFYGKDVGDKMKVTMELMLMSKSQELVKLSIEKIITDEETSTGGEAKPSLKEPIMAHMSRGKSTKKDMPMGPHNRPAQPVENSEEPWRTSYA